MAMMPRRISVVICAYNEAARIGSVLEALRDHPSLLETIVVDDGSHDGTSDVVRKYPVRLITLTNNVGKSKAFLQGVAAAAGDLIMCLDADLKNLQPHDVTDLAAPVLEGRADVTISLRGNTLYAYKAIGLDFVSGERVLPRSLITDYADTIASLPSYGLETFVNERIIDRKLRIAIVPLRGVYNTRKRNKMGWWEGTLADWKMSFQVLRVTSLWGIIRQNYNMLKLAKQKA